MMEINSQSQKKETVQLSFRMARSNDENLHQEGFCTSCRVCLSSFSPVLILLPLSKPIQKDLLSFAGLFKNFRTTKVMTWLGGT